MSLNESNQIPITARSAAPPPLREGVSFLIINETGKVLFSSPQSTQRYQLIENDQIEWISIEGSATGGIRKSGTTDGTETQVIVTTVFDLFWHGEKAKMLLLESSQFKDQVFREISKTRETLEIVGLAPWISFTSKSNQTFNLISVEHQALELTGFSIAQLISKNVNAYRKLIANDDKAILFLKIQKAVDESRPYQVIYRIRHSSGEVRWVQEQGQAIKSKNGQIETIEGWIIDVTESKRIEDALWESESRYRSLVEASPDAVLLLDKNGYIVLGNDHFCSILGVADPEEILGKNILDYLDADTRILINNNIEGLINNYPVSGKGFRLLSQNGVSIPVETNLSIIRGSTNEVNAYIVIARDIRQREQAQQALRESEARYRAIVEDNPEMIIRFQQDSTITFANAAFGKFVNLSSSELIGFKLNEKIKVTGHHLVEKLISLATPKMGPLDNEFTIHTSSRNDHCYRWKTTAIKDENGDFLEYQSIGEDISNQKRTQQVEKESEYRLRELMENIKLVALILDPNGKVTFCNSYFTELTGWQKDEAINQDWVSKFVPLDHRVKLRRYLIESALQGKMPVHNENPILTKIDEQKLIAWNNTILRDANGDVTGIASLGEDITEKRLSDKIQEAIFKISVSANESEDLPSLFKSIHEVLKVLMPAENFFIALYDSEKDLISFPFFVDEFDTQPEPQKPGRGLTEYVLRTGKTLLVDPEEFEALIATGEVESIGPPSVDWIGVPLKTENKIIGVMGVQTYSPGIRYQDRDEQILAFVSTQVAMAIERKSSEQALRTSQKRNELLIKASMDAILIEKMDGTILDCNDVALQMYGYSHEEILKLNISDLVQPEFVQDIPDYTQWELAQGNFVQESPNIRKNGEVFPVEVSIRQTNIEGTPVLVSFTRDITAQKQAAKVIIESEEKFRTLAENTAAGIFIHREGNYLYVNPMWCQITGYSASELLGMTPEDVLSPEFALGAIERFHVRLQNLPNPEMLERPIITRNGEKQILDLYLATIDFEGEKAIIGTAVDITNRKQREHELEVIAEMSEAYRINNTREEVLSIALLKLVDILKSDGAFISIIDPDISSIELKKASGEWKELENMPLSLGQGLSGHIIKTGQPYLNTLASKDPYISFPEMVKEFSSVAGVPLITSGITVGSLVIGTRHQFTENDLRLLRAIGDLTASALHRTELFEKIRQQASELKQAYNSTLEGWALALELRDKETQGHSVRIANMVLELARRMSVPEEQMETIRRGALLHDIGKLGVPDIILLKHGKLTGEEWAIMQKHPTYAYEMLSQIKDFKDSIDIPYCHHEWWDGSGYPRGLEGRTIPLPARIFSIIDVWDALTSNRPYRAAWKRSEALAHIINQAGTHFDPDVVNEFIQMIVQEK